MIFSNKTEKVMNISVEIDGTEIRQVSSTKFLGIYLDNLMKWDAHIITSSKKFHLGCMP